MLKLKETPLNIKYRQFATLVKVYLHEARFLKEQLIEMVLLLNN